jgi:hypothetical protein
MCRPKSAGKDKHIRFPDPGTDDIDKNFLVIGDDLYREDSPSKGRQL